MILDCNGFLSLLELVKKNYQITRIDKRHLDAFSQQIRFSLHWIFLLYNSNGWNKFLGAACALKKENKIKIGPLFDNIHYFDQILPCQKISLAFFLAQLSKYSECVFDFLTPAFSF